MGIERTISGDHLFGGEWTRKKLEAIEKYLSAYNTALKAKPTPERPFERIYIDAFAGTGFQTRKRGGRRKGEPAGQRRLFDNELRELLDGSARKALAVDPPFQQYIFIDQSQSRCEALTAAVASSPDRKLLIYIRHGDANDVIRDFCEREFRPRSQRAVLFLDPYGTEVKWSTLEVVAATGAIDVWYLFPLMAVVRMLKKRGEIRSEWSSQLDRVFGTTKWREALYRPRPRQGRLFADDDDVEKASIDTICAFVIERLATIFPAVAPSPAMLRNATKSPLFLLCFAMGNRSPAAQKLALKIAGHILRGFD